MHYSRLRKHGDVGPARKLWRKGADRRLDATGYVRVRIEDKWLLEHRVVMQALLGRPFFRGESIHHMNGIRDDNRPENLELWVTPQKNGQRVTDLVAFVCEHYPDLVREHLLNT